MIVCLDILGNYADIHTEWKGEQGSGGAPAYSVSTLLLNLQSILLELDRSIGPSEKASSKISASLPRCLCASVPLLR